MMKAIVCTKYGSPEVLELKKDVAKPIPSDGEVLIKIHATSVTASDALIRGLNDKQKNGFFLRILLQIIFGFYKPRNPILGMTLSGEIEDTGTTGTGGVTNNIFKKGDKVFAYGDKRFGSYAEYICLHENWNVLPKPTNISHKEAACVSYGGLLAMHCLKKANMNIHQPGQQKVLIYGASGSIGTMAVQLAAKEKGAVVTAVCSKRNFELVESLGAVKMIDYTQPQAQQQEEEESEVYDYVIDAVGDSKTSELKEALKRKYRKGGKYISIDDDLPSTKKEDFMKLRELVEKGVLSPVIDKCFDLEEMVEAHKYVDLGHKRGNVAILVTDKANDK